MLPDNTFKDSTDLAANNIVVQCQGQLDEIDLFVHACAAEREYPREYPGLDVQYIEFELSRLAATKASLLMFVAVKTCKALKSTRGKLPDRALKCLQDTRLQHTVDERLSEKSLERFTRHSEILLDRISRFSIPELPIDANSLRGHDVSHVPRTSTPNVTAGATRWSADSGWLASPRQAPTPQTERPTSLNEPEFLADSSSRG